MQIHGPSEVVDGITVRFSGPGLVMADFGSSVIYLQSTADADALIRAAVAAKDLLLGETVEHDPAADLAAYLEDKRTRTCGAARIGYGPCVREHVHPGWHATATGEEWPQYTQDRDLDAILNGPSYRAPAIELPAGSDT